MPNSTAASPHPINAPIPTLKPASSAKDAPVSDNSLEPCTAKDICRITMNGPIKPDTNASSAAASSACCTKSRPSRSAVTSNAKRFDKSSDSRSVMGMSARVPGVIEVLADHDVAAADLHHFDVCAVQLGQRPGCHHLFDAADAESAVDEIQHPVHELQDGVHLVGDEQQRGVGLATPLVDQRGHQSRVGGVEVQQRLVAQQ